VETIDVSKYCLNDWLEIVFNPPKDKLFISNEFPSDKVKQEYLNTIHLRSDEEVKILLLKFLMWSGTIPMDELHLQNMIWDKDNRPKMFEVKSKLMFFKRLFNYYKNKGKSVVLPWEGITWILDLLPHWPNKALEALDSYILAHAQLFPDSGYSGHCEAEEIIRAKFIGFPQNTDEYVAELKRITPHEFEFLIQGLYDKMEYKTKLTKQTRDGGKDIIAVKNKPSRKEKLLIECKNYNSKIGVDKLRNLLGVVSSEKANKGVLVSTSMFTKTAKRFSKDNPRIEIIDCQQLVLLLNEYLGSNWPLKIDTHVRRKELIIGAL
jgi:restriction system protein